MEVDPQIVRVRNAPVIDEAINATVANDTCVANSTVPGCNATLQSHMLNNTESNSTSIISSEEDDGEDDENDKERVCDTLRMCIITTLNQGLRNGGGIGDVLRSPSSLESLFLPRIIYDLLFFFVVIIIILNLIFGVIIDTFADLRSEKQQKEEILKNTCFICGLNRAAFDNKTTSFEEHIRHEHNASTESVKL